MSGTGARAEPTVPAYRRSAGSARSVARKEALLSAVADDLALNGMTDYSLRRAARAAGTTHKVLLYHFDGIEDILRQALARLRQRRIDRVQAAFDDTSTLVGRVQAVWPLLMDDASGLRVIDQAIGLAMYDPVRYAHLAQDAADAYVDPLMSMCPAAWSTHRKREVAEMIMATMRGFLMEWRTTRDGDRIDAGVAALLRAVEREEAAAD